MSNSVESFLERLQSMSPKKKPTSFVKRRAIETVYTNAKANFGKYQLLPLTSVINDFPYVSLKNTREIKMPRKNVMSDGTPQEYSAWIKLLPKDAYTIKDPSTGREVSSLTAADESLLDQAYAIWEELYKELDAKNNVMNPAIGGLIRRKTYSLFMARVMNYWSVGNTREVARQNFSALMVVTSKGFMDTVGESISDTSITAGAEDWIKDVYNRDASGRKGFLMFNISKSESPGFNISVSHSLNAENYLNGVTIPDEDLELMQNPVQMFLGWQAGREDDSVPADQRRLFNKALITEAIEFMTDLLAKTRMAKANGTSVEEAIEATNKTLLAHQTPTDTRGQATNDPVLAQMAQAAAQQQAQPSGGYGNNNLVGTSGQDIATKNNDPFRNAPAAHLDAITGAPIVPGSANPGQAAPFERPQFAGSNFGGGSNGLPF